MSADERESDSNQPRVAYMQQQQQQQGPYLPPGISRETSIATRPPFPGAAPAPPGSLPSQMATARPHGQPMQPGQAVNRLPMTTLCGPMPRPPFVPSTTMGGQTIPGGASGLPGPPPPGGSMAAGPNSKDTITVKELMINVIEKSLSNPYQAAGSAPPGAANASGHPSQPPPSPTIQNLLDSSSKIPTQKPNFVKERVGLNPLSRVGTMAPPAAPPPSSVASVPTSSPSVSGAGGSSSAGAPGAPEGGLDLTLDLSMPRRRESAATPPSHFAQVRDPSILHRRSPFNATSAGAPAPDARPAPPPPAHSNKVKTDPYLREISPSSYEGRSSLASTSPRLVSPGPARPPSSNSRLPPPPQPQGYMGRSAGMTPTTMASAGRQPALSPKMTSKPPLTIQTGSITQGTPAIQQRYGEPLLAKMTPPEPRQAGGGGSITQGTPCYDKNNMRRENAYYPPVSRAGPPGSQGPPVSAAYPEQHLSSRHVIMNDFAMARSTEMPRRVDSRDAHARAMSPATSAAAANNRSALRDLSPRPRTGGVDPRVAAAAASQISRESQGGRPVSTDPRRDPLYIAAALAEQHNRNQISGLPEPRGDPKADMGPSARGDPRASMPSRAQAQQQQQQQQQQPPSAPRSPGATLSRNYFMGQQNVSQAGQSAAGHSQQVYLTSDGRYSTSSRISRSPPRSTPPPARPNMAMPRQGGITSGKPVVTKELYRGAPEVTISKTSSPRGLPYAVSGDVPNNALATLVDVAGQQSKIDLSHIRTQQQAQAAALMAMASNPKAAHSLAAAASASVRISINY